MPDPNQDPLLPMPMFETSPGTSLANILANAGWARPDGVAPPAAGTGMGTGGVSMPTQLGQGAGNGLGLGMGGGRTGHPLLDALAAARGWWNGLAQPTPMPGNGGDLGTQGHSGTLRPVRGQMMR